MSEPMRNLVIGTILLCGLAMAGGCHTASPALPEPGPGPSATASPAGPDLAGKTSVVLEVRGMSCDVCAATVSQSLKALAGVEATQANPTTGQVTVTLAPDHRLTAADLTRAVENAGYTLDRITPNTTVPGKP